MLYNKSVNRLRATKITEITMVMPITTGRSSFFKALTKTEPIPSQLKISSTNTAPASNEANHPEIAVITGFMAFLSACFHNIENGLNPFALAVLIKSLDNTSSIDFLVSSRIMARGRIPYVKQGNIKLAHLYSLTPVISLICKIEPLGSSPVPKILKE